MKKLGIVVALMACAGSASAQVILSGADPALTGASVIDFEAFTLGNYASLTDGNVTFSAEAGETLRIAAEGEGGQYGHNGQHLQNNYGNTSPILISFLNPVTAFGLRHGAMDYSWTMNVFGAGNALLGTTGITPTSGDPVGGYIGWSGAGITSAELVMPTPDWVQFDDFAYVEGQVVPEPATLLLLGSGLLGVAVIGRRRREGDELDS